MKLAAMDITPDPSLFEKSGLQNYSLHEAIGDLVDNGADARDGKFVRVGIAYSPETITVEDDGVGMNEREFREALKLGKTEKRLGAQGAYGIGMKAAAMCLGRRFSITTARAQDKFALRVVFDAETFKERNKWELFPERVSKDFPHGTRVDITELRVQHNTQAERRLRESLGRTFKRLIVQKELELTVNGTPVDPHQFDLEGGSRREILLEVGGQKIVGWVARQANRRKTKQPYGFDLLRKNRVISPHNKVGLTEHAGISGVFVGEIDLDAIPTVFSKNAFLTESHAWKDFEEQLRDAMAPLIRQRRARYSEGRVGSPRRTSTVRETPAESYPGTKNEGAQVSTAESSNGYDFLRTVCDAFQPLLGDMAIKHRFERLGKNSGPFRVERLTTGGGTVMIRTNMDSDVYMAFPQPAAWSLLHVYEGVKRILIEIAGTESDMLELLQKEILKLAPKCVA